MAKKKNGFGKFLALTTTAAAVGGACYIFRDKIKESSLYQASVKKLSGLFKPEEDEDFYFDDEDEDFEDIFSEDLEHGREYTSITINAKNTDTEEEDTLESVDESKTEDTFKPEDILSFNEEVSPTDTPDRETDIPTKSEEIRFTPSSSAVEPSIDILAYENEGLSDSSEDSDVLEEQDKLDF